MSSNRTIDDRDWGRRALSRAQKRSIGALAEAMLSTEDEEGLRPARPALVARAIDELDLLVGAGSSDLHRGYGILSWLIEWLPLVIIGAFSRASRLPLARRLAYLEALDRSRLPLVPTLLMSVKLPITMLAFELEPELALTGYDRSTLSSRRVLPQAPRTEIERAPSVPPGGLPRVPRPAIPLEAEARPKPVVERT